MSGTGSMLTGTKNLLDRKLFLHLHRLRDKKAETPPIYVKTMNTSNNNMSLRSLRLRRVVLFVLVLFSIGSGVMLMG